MATEEEMQAVLAKSQMKATLARSQIKLNRMSERAFTPGQTVGVTQMPRVSGAGNGYFSIDGANSYGYCAENKKNFGVIMVQNMARLQNGMMLLQEKSYITLREDQGMPEII